MILALNIRKVEVMPQIEISFMKSCLLFHAHSSTSFLVIYTAVDAADPPNILIL